MTEYSGNYTAGFGDNGLWLRNPWEKENSTTLMKTGLVGTSWCLPTGDVDIVVYLMRRVLLGDLLTVRYFLGAGQPQCVAAMDEPMCC